MSFAARLSCLLFASCLLSACQPSPPKTIADRIYYGGPIITVDDTQPTVEALAIKNGIIIALGKKQSLEKNHANSKTLWINLSGRTLTPGFIDGHAHFLGFGSQAVGANLLAPPDGGINNIDDLVEALKTFSKSPDVSRTGWVFGIGYDDALLGRHPTRDDLDKVSTELPVIAVHISGHFSAVNSKGLQQIGYTAATQDPEGGIIRRYPNSQEPNGVLEELASFPHMLPAVNAQSADDKNYFLSKGLALAKSYGYTTVNEGRLMAFQHADLLNAAKRQLLDIDVMSYVDYTAVEILAEQSLSYNNRYRVAGMKITLDGSPQGRTAWRTTPYLLPPDGQSSDYAGYPAIPNTAEVTQLIDLAYQKSWPVQIHANGDAAIDQMLAAIRPAQQKYGKGDRRHTLIHGQFLRHDQIPQLKELEIFPSLFPMHTFYWGDWYETIIGAEAAQKISPMRSVLDAGMMATTHTDAPVALPNLLQVMWATVNRSSRSGKIIGADERITAIEALKGFTLWAAHQHFEENIKGSLAIGKLADMVILSDNPLTIAPEKLIRSMLLKPSKKALPFINDLNSQLQVLIKIPPKRDFY